MYQRRSRNKLIIFAVLLVVGGIYGVHNWMHYLAHRKALREERLTPPPEALAHRRARQYPWAEGLTRQERAAAWKAYGQSVWEQSSSEEKLEIARGFFPDVTRPLHLRPDQEPEVRRVYEETIGSLIPVWDGFWRENFNRQTAFMGTLLVMGQTSQRLDTILDAKQKEILQGMLARMRQGGEREGGDRNAR